MVPPPTRDMGNGKEGYMPLDRHDLLRRVSAALADVDHPRTGRDVLSGGQVRGLEADDEGAVRFQFVLSADDPGKLVKAARAAVEAVHGVARVKVDVKLPQTLQAQAQPQGRARRRHAQPAQARSGPARSAPPGSVPMPTPEPETIRSLISHVVAISSGKGGVGKSTVAANLAAALADSGLRVGLLDADVYGPDIPLLFGEHGKPRVTGARGQEKIVPLEAHGVRLMSIGFLLEEEQPAIMRGPLISGILRQFLEQVEWGELDYLIVDMPPGTGDAQLSLVQTVDVDGAVMVTTPQDVSTGDVRRAIRMFERVKTRVLGVIENMSGFACPHCGHDVDIFGHGGGQRLAKAVNVPLLGTVPLDPAVRVASDAGVVTALSAPDSAAGRAFREVAEGVVAEVGGAAPARG